MALLSGKILIALLGLVIPGYALARALRLRHSAFAAFPLSALIICQSVTSLAIFNSKITFPAVATILILITAACSLPLLLMKTARDPAGLSENGSDSASPWFKPAVATAVIILLAVTFRATLYPLGGFDTFTRWDALAREMLHYRSLSFYPPITGADFSIYTMPDGFPPLVASVYWWLYAATGAAMPQLTAISVILQLASILGLAWCAAKTAFGETAAAFTLLAMTASPLLINSVQIGQESGFLALAVAGQICFALAAIRTPAPAPIYASALFGVLAALAREYGPVLALPGFFILISNPVTRRLSWRYALLAAALASPWYLRNWVISGSPLYPLTLPGSPHANRLLTALMAYYGEIFGIAAFNPQLWFELLCALVSGGLAALLAALPFLAKNSRKFLPYTLSLALVTLLWLWSIGKTSGGVIYSLRVLAPAVVILDIIAGGSLAGLAKEKWAGRLLWLLIPATLWGILSALSFPSPPWQISTSIFSTKDAAPEFCAANMTFASRINKLGIPATAILTDSPYLAVILHRETGFRPVIIWSSEISPVISPERSSNETGKLLLEKGISLVALNRSSIHNELLFRTPFYRDGVKEWRELVQDGDWALFAIDGRSGR